MNTFEWADATTIGEAVGGLEADVLLKAGGVDLMDLLKERLIEPKRLVNIRRISGLDRVSENAEGLRIGPLVTLAALAADQRVSSRYRALAEAAGQAATPQIRNLATSAGNLAQRSHCWYFRMEQFQCRKKGGERCFAIEGEHRYHALFDNAQCAAVHPSTLATALVALGATLELTSAEKKWTLPVEELFVKASADVRQDNRLEPGHMITELRLPRLSEGSSSAYLKLGEKESYDWPLVEAAAVLERGGDGKVTRASIVMGGVAHHPYRAVAAEKLLLGKTIDAASAVAAAAAALQGATPLPGNQYKVRLAQVLVRRVLLAAAARRV